MRDDKVLAPTEVRSFLSGPVVLEEKVDGANLGLSFGQTGAWRFQNRGHWLEGKLTNQWEPLRGWAATHEAAIRAALPENHILFGEWCYLKHSILYDRLPDWFLVFDVYDCVAKRFWGTKRRDALAVETHYQPYLKQVCPGIHQIEPGKADDSGTAGLRLATIHRVKGLEFDYVVPAGRLDDLDAQVEASESTAQKRSRLYVAATRARCALFVHRLAA